MTNTVPIPSWNAEGLLPPTDMANPTSANRAPYPVSLTDFVLRFCTSPERRDILSGFLEYRAALHALGLDSGFQWVNGSFVENIEIGDRRRPPKDVDVVNFCPLPLNRSEEELVKLSPELFPSTTDELLALKVRFKVDGYTVILNKSAEILIEHTTYWYSLWAHQRATFAWKGFLRLDLAPAEDAAARALLANPMPGGAG